MGSLITLRELKKKDAPFMLEWMHDSDVTKFFKRNMLDMTLEDAQKFCESSALPACISNGISLHFAIVDENDEYLGTVSLKNIDTDSASAEYAISLRKKAAGRGVATKASQLLLRKGFVEYQLHRIYLNVYADNMSAIKLYEKLGFTYEGEFRDHFNIRGKYMNWKWYGMLRDEFDQIFGGGGQN